MKNFLLAILFLIFGLGFTPSSAQINQKSNNKNQTTKLKKDGTPDMRYKENKKDAAKSTKHLKKDGTPDKRYSENKKKK